MRVASSDGVELVLHDLGGEGPPLLVAHATGFLAAPYRPFARHLHERFHVWAVDFRGHGDTAPRADGNQSWTGMSDDVCACLDALGPDPIVAFGHSMGGAALLMAALRRPAAFRGLFLYEPIITPSEFAHDRPGGGNPMAAAASRRRPTFPSRPEVLARYASRPPMNLLRADVLWEYVEHGFADGSDGSVSLKCAPAIEAATFDNAGAITLEQLPAIATPSVVASGATETDALPGQVAPLAADRLPHCRSVVYPTLGHFGPFQDPLAVAIDVLEFAGSLN